MGNTAPVRARAACKGFIEITNTQTGEQYLLNVKRIVQVTRAKLFVKISVVQGTEELSYEIHRDCYAQILQAISQACGPPFIPEDDAESGQKR
ncbi:hypothetical protein DIPPA_56096 [Diplonema papillatum]|nr:hypothetical protein DIPPA_56096 [Diplonema papillatum]